MAIIKKRKRISAKLEGNPESMIIQDALVYADCVANFLNNSGYKADFSLESLKEIDRFFDDQASYGQPIAGGLLASDTGSRIFALGAYIGEVVRRTYGGHWKGDDSDPLAEIMIELHLPDGRSFQPVHVVIKRLRDASQDGLHLIFQDFSSTI